jgi:hypothetical protein
VKFTMPCGCAPLSLERSSEGWVQRARWTHPDLHDELVEELVSLSTPLAAVGAAAAHRTAIGYTLLLLGDQNAGKSTFLHAFANAEHAGWLELLSILPILSASFANAQFRTDAPDPKGGGAPAMDQPPFLDTDVGRTSFLLTLEDFSLFIDEYELPIAMDELRAMSAASVRYAAVELIEIGGDHLDRMVARRAALRGSRSINGGAGDGHGHAECDGDALRSTRVALETALGRSEELVQAAEVTYYFVNASTLLAIAPPAASARTVRLVLHSPAVLTLVRRMRYLASVLPRGQRVVLKLSRLAEMVETARGGGALGGALVFDAQSIEASVADWADWASADEALSMTRGLNAQLDARALAARALSRVERAASHTVADVDADADDAAQDNAHDNAQGLEGAQLLCAFLPELLTDLLTMGDEVGGGGALRFDDDAELTGAMLSSEGPGVGGGGAPIPRLDARAVVGTLAQLLGRSSRHAPITASVPAETTAMRSGAAQLLACFKDVHSRLAAGGSFDPWVRPSTWHAHLEERHEQLELPATTLLASFAPLARRLAAGSLVLLSRAGGHAPMRLSVSFHPYGGGVPSHGEWAPPWAPPGLSGGDRADELAVRFPYHPPLLRVIEAQLACALPSQWWVELGGEGSGDGVAAVAVGIDLAALEGATRSLEERLQELLLVGLTADDASWALWLLLLEEWCLAQRLASTVHANSRAGGVGGLVRAQELELQLYAPETRWRAVLLPHLVQPPPCQAVHPDEVEEGSWHVHLRIEDLMPASERLGRGDAEMGLESAFCVACE